MKTISKRTVALVFATTLAMAWTALDVHALDRDDLVFHATFDHGFDAAFAAGSAVATVEGNARLVRDPARQLIGRNGTQGAFFAERGDLIRYALDGNVHLSQGAVSLWIYELDKGRLWNPYFQVAGAEEALNVLRPWQPMIWSAGFWRQGEMLTLLGGPILEVPGNEVTDSGLPKAWAHLLFTWRGNEAAFYVNGKLIKRQGSLNYKFLFPPESFTLGRPLHPTVNADPHHTGEHMLKDSPDKAEEMKIGKEPYGAYLLDDVAVFNRFLGPDEVATLYEKPLEEALAAGASGTAQLYIFNYPSIRRVRVDADFGTRVSPDASAQVRVLKADGTPTDIAVTLKHTPGGFDYGWLDVNSLPVGTYQVTATLEQADKQIAAAPPQSFEVFEPEEWMTNTYGAEDVVLPGFEPLEADGAVVQLWGRTYDFTDAIMPRQVVNQGKKMLARPINWFVRVNGQDLPLTVEAMTLTESSATRARYEGKGKLGPLEVTAKVMVEYDGFMKFELAFDPGTAPVAVERIWMDIPLHPSQSSNLYHSTRRSGAWETDWRSPLRLIVTSAMTLGTPGAALQWLTESDQHYYPRGNPAALETLEDAEARVFRTNLIAAPKRLDQPFSLTFALHAGPARPRPANWRGQSVGYRYFQTHWCRSPGDLIPMRGYDDPGLENLIDGTSIHFQGFRSFTERDLEKRLPEWERYEQEWIRVPHFYRANQPVGHPQGSGWNEVMVDSNSSWAQWNVYNAYQLFSRTKMRGLYYDDWYHGVSMNEAAGSGYVDEHGLRRPTWPLFSQREIHRRVYAIVKKFRPEDGIKILHTSAWHLLPIMPYFDYTLEGEIMGWVDLLPPEGNYFKTYTLDLMQMLFAGYNTGVINGVMYEPHHPLKEAPWNQRRLFALRLTHDMHVNNPRLLALYIREGFPLDGSDVVFHPYWEEQPAAQALRSYVLPPDGTPVPQPDDTLWAVAYTKPGDQALVVVARKVADDQAAPAVVEVKLDREKLGLPKGRLAGFSLESLGRTGQGTVTGDLLQVEIGADDFAAVILRPGAEVKP